MRCSKCRIEKDADCFAPSYIKRGRGYCHLCDNNQNKKSRIKKPKYYIWKRVRANALSRGLDFSLRVEDIPDIPEFCSVFPWLRLEYAIGEGTKPNTASVDRIDNTKGYFPGNIRIISRRANILKSDATLEELIALVKDAGHSPQPVSY